MVRRRNRVACWRSGLGYYRESGSDSQTGAGNFVYNSGDFRAASWRESTSARCPESGVFSGMHGFGLWIHPVA